MKKYQLIILTAMIWLGFTTLSLAGNVKVTARVNQQNIYLSHPFSLTITVEGADDISQPEAIEFPNFRTIFLGQSQNSSIIITNGRQTSAKTIALNYQLTLASNSTTIPPVTIIADGKPYTTKPIAITVKQPEENENFKLEVRLSKPTAYVGEPLLMTTTWFIGQKARGGEFNLPILTDPRFTTRPRTDLLPKSQNQLIQIELANETILAKQYQTKIGNRDFMAITFFHTIIPRTTGRLTLPLGTIAISARTGYGTPQARLSLDPFGRFNRQREIYSTIVIPTNSVTLNVLPLPSKNIPAQFNGLVGEYTIQANASPTTVNVGDPIRLTLKISGDSAQTITMPPLALSGFKLSTDPPKQKNTDDSITFSTTIRANHERVHEVPAITIAFFNVETGRYETSQTKPIPITVRATRIITAADALGGNSNVPSKALAPRQEVHQGIHYNYSDIKETSDPSENSLILWLTLILPPTLFILTVLLTRDIDEDRKALNRRKKQALKRLQKNIASAEGTALFAAWLTFLGDKLGRPAQSITANDVLPLLSNHPELQQAVQEIFKTGEAMTYGRKDQSLQRGHLSKTASQLHKVIK